MESTSSVVTPTRRPGGRTAEVTKRVNDAVLGLLVEGGVAACTFKAVAGRAGVERSTLYRRYSDRWAMLIDAILDYASNMASPGRLGSFREDLRFLLHRAVEILTTPVGPSLWAAGAALRAGAAPEHRERFWQSRLAQILPVLDAAKSRGEIDSNVDPVRAFAFALGAIHFRMLIIGERVDSNTIDQIVDDICRLYCRPGGISRNGAAGSARGNRAGDRGSRRSLP